jgi:hypothetical protein
LDHLAHIEQGVLTILGMSGEQIGAALLKKGVEALIDENIDYTALVDVLERLKAAGRMPRVAITHGKSSEMAIRVVGELQEARDARRRKGKLAVLRKPAPTPPPATGTAVGKARQRWAGWEVTLRPNQGEVVTPDTVVCPNCRSRGAARRGGYERVVLDAVGKRVVLRSIMVQQWRCRVCHRQFTTSSGVVPRRLVTEAARDILAYQCADDGVTETARRYGLDPKTMKAIWWDWAGEQVSPVPVPSMIGLFRVFYAGAWRTAVVEPGDAMLIDLLSGDDSETVVAWAKRRFAHRLVHRVVIDVHLPYRQAVATAIPEAKVEVAQESAVGAFQEVLEAIGDHGEGGIGLGVVDAAQRDLAANGVGFLSLFGLQHLGDRLVSGQSLNHVVRLWGDVMLRGVGMPGLDQGLKRFRQAVGDLPGTNFLHWRGAVLRGLGPTRLCPPERVRTKLGIALSDF